MNLLPVKGNENGILVDGYIGKPVISRGNRNYENYFVNGRYLKNNIISKAIEEGYKGHAMVHKFPFTALMISMDRIVLMPMFTRQRWRCVFEMRKNYIPL